MARTPLVLKTSDYKIGFVWNIDEFKDDRFLLHTSTGLYEFKSGKIKKLATDFSRFFNIHGNTFFIKNGYLFSSNTVDSIEVFSDPQLSKEIRLITGEPDSLHFITSDGSTFYLNNSEIKESNLSSSLKSGTIYSGRTLDDSVHALSYVEEGLQIIGSSNMRYSKSNGLNGSFVKDNYLDAQKNIWVSMREGVAKIGFYSPFQKLYLKDEIESWSSHVDVNSVYVGSSSGILQINNKGILNVVLSDVVYKMINHGDKIFVAGREGFYILNNGEVMTKIEDRLGSTAKIINDTILFTGSGQGLSLYSIKEESNIEKLQHVEVARLTYTDALQLDDQIWIGTKSSGLYCWDIASNSLSHYNSPNDFEDNFYLKPVVIQNTLHCFAPNGLYSYEKSSNSFIKLFSFNNAIQYVFQGGDNQFIVSSKNRFGDMELDIIEITEESYRIISKELNGFDHSTVTHINKDDQGNYWFSTPEGLFKYDIEKAKSFNHEVGYNTLVSQVTSNDSLIFGGYYAISSGDYPKMVLDQPDSYKPNLNFSNNALKFEFAAPYFTQNDKIQFSYYLEGNEPAWSSWNKERVKEYNNLSPGTYTFHVKSKNVFDVIGRTASYTFTILPPWYMTNWAYILFTMGGFGLVWLIVITYSYRVRQQRKNLKLVVADRTFEVLSQKKEIEKQNQLLQDQFQEIRNQRDSINEKNQELEMSQEEILTINEQLHRLNQSLEKKVEERTSKIKSTVKKLQKTIAELDTFIYRASHDLKGPISRINGLTSLAKLESSNEQDLKYYDLINLVAKDMNVLLAKLTQVHEVINCEMLKTEIDLHSLIAEVRDTISFVDHENNTHYSFNLTKSLQIKSDPFLMTVIFTNIIENALIFKKPKQLDHELKISSDEDHDNYYLTFEDNGIGIKDEHLKKVFDMFYRGSDQSKGNGLGLYLTKMSVEKLEGKIQIESTFEEFTRVNISIPK